VVRFNAPSTGRAGVIVYGASFAVATEVIAAVLTTGVLEPGLMISAE
jgi:hypothetical protein